MGKEPSIKYVTLFLANFFSPSLCHTLSHIPGPPQSTSHISGPPIFSRPSTKNPDKSPLYKFSLNCLRGFCPGGFVRGSLVWKVLSGVVCQRVFGLEGFVRGGLSEGLWFGRFCPGGFVHSSFSHNTSVTTESSTSL